METIKRVVILFLILNCNVVFAQEKNVIQKGLLSAQLSLSPSKMIGENESHFYLHGSFEGFISDKISISGEGFYYLGNLSSKESVFDYNHNLFFGASRHFTKNNHDIYIGLQPGVSITKLNPDVLGLETTKSGVNPVFSGVVGYNFYINNVFHFFVQTRYITGEHNYDIHKNLSELRFSAGLGFNLNSI